MSEENVARIKRQNQKKISVIIGNPPYNANQLNENENNKNREYPEIDNRIKETYIAFSTAQKTKRYDMYSRFVRWASDRVDENGIVAFITNRNYIDGREADGFRKSLAAEFEEIWVIDLGGDWKKRGVAGGGNVFGIGTGVAIGFLVKTQKRSKNPRIFYTFPNVADADEKLSWLASSKLENLKVESIKAEGEGYWIDKPDADVSELMPIASKSTRSAKRPSMEKAIFKEFSLGVSTNRDEWVYDSCDEWLMGKVRLLTKLYDEQDPKAGFDPQIKWSETLKHRFQSGQRESVSESRIRSVLYRPYTNLRFYASHLFVDRPGALESMFPSIDVKNPTIFVAVGRRGQFGVCASQMPVSLDFFVPNAACLFPSRRFGKSGSGIDNVTDWALTQFSEHYGDSCKLRERITKVAIFHYVYGVLHDPIYREKYALNLKRDLPHIPFYSNFWKWADWGERLLALHIGYDAVEPWPLERVDVPDERSRKAGLAPRTMLKASKETGVIQIDSETQLTGVPPQAWTYLLGNRSALEWILDQQKEKTPKDSTIRAKFNNYLFADNKEKVVDLLRRVTRVSVETMQIVEGMRAEER